MVRRHCTSTRRCSSAAAAVLALTLLAAGCTGATQPAESSSASAPGQGTPAAAAACVTDIPAVIARPASPASVTGTLPADLVAKLHQAADTGFEQAAASGAVVGVRTPQGTWTKTYGYADPIRKTPMEVGVHTRIGSITKTFTGTMLMQLAEKKLLSLDDPIEQYVHGIPNGERITLRQLANMTSGVASYTRNPKFTKQIFAKPHTVFTTRQLVSLGVRESPLFEPGAKFDYSNTNTILLGVVIARVAGHPIDAVLDEQILQPLGLKQTVWPGTSTKLPEPYAKGFTLQGDYATPFTPSNATNWNPSWAWTAGALISDLDDLLVYGRALGTGQGLLSPETQAERLASFPSPAGYGIAMGCVDGWIGHTGELPGYNTALYYDTTTDTTVVVQTNSDIASGDCPADTPTLYENSKEWPCSAPATRIFTALTGALGHPFVMP